MATVLVTGANRGIGLELARQYAGNGWSVIATARNPEKAVELNKIAKEHKSRLEVMAVDVTSEDAVENLAEQLDGRAIDILVNNAAMYPRQGVHAGDLDYDAWGDTLETNLLGVMRVTEALLENVAKSERKQIAAISSGMGSFAGRRRRFRRNHGRCLPVPHQQGGIKYGHADLVERIGAARNFSGDD